MVARAIAAAAARRSITRSRILHNYSAPHAFFTSLAGSGHLAFFREDYLDPSLPLAYQVRWKRKDGNKAFSKPRPPTRKQSKEYHRRRRKQLWEKVGKHSPPGSKAGPRRQWMEEQWQELLDWKKEEDPEESVKQLEYNYGDALVDDLIGNSSNYTSAPTPTPVYLGHKHREYYNEVRNQMEGYRKEQEEIQAQVDQGEKQVMEFVPPPDDLSISLVVRAYRDRHGTKNKPIGIVKALEHLVNDLKLPVSFFRELTYTSLLTCCRTPNEARRIFRLMKKHDHEISVYSWSILVDIHAKIGDPEGCDEVMKEMVKEGVAPSLAAYTSLLAACHKVCNAGHIPHAVRARVGQLGWERFKEMRVVGLEPDVMAYGAFLRLCAARGHPERAINVLEEMQVMQVKPTTLCFTSALRAVARSHQISVRYEGAGSKKNKRREQSTSHHGKMARNIVILAEAAEVQQDDGFVAALMLCAAAAGDTATAKAVLLASEVRKLDQFRTIGSDAHLKSLQGGKTNETNNTMALDSATGEMIPLEGAEQALAEPKSEQDIFEEREYGRDTRKLSALMYACSNAIENKGLGGIWAGKENKGYLCDNSLRLILARPEPQYYDNSVPGISSLQMGLDTIKEDDQPKMMGKRERRKKFQLEADESVGTTMDDIPKEFHDLFIKEAYGDDQARASPNFVDTMQPGLQRNADEALVRVPKGAQSIQPQESTGTTMGDLDREFHDLFGPSDNADLDKEFHDLFGASDNAGNADETQFDFPEGTQSFHFNAASGSIQPLQSEEEKNAPVSAAVVESDEEWYFDDDAMKWNTRPRQKVKRAVTADQSAHIESKSDGIVSSQDDDLEYFFDDDEMKWKMRAKIVKNSTTKFEETRLRELERANQAQPIAGDGQNVSLEEDQFQQFLAGLKQEIRESGEDIDIDEKEAREMFQMAQKDFPEMAANWKKPEEDKISQPKQDFETFYQSLKDEWGNDDFIDENQARELYDAGMDQSQLGSETNADEPSENFDEFYQSLKDDGFEIDEEQARELHAAGMDFQLGSEAKTDEPSENFDEFYQSLKESGIEIDKEQARELHAAGMDQSQLGSGTNTDEPSENFDEVYQSLKDDGFELDEEHPKALHDAGMYKDEEDDSQEEELSPELQRILDGITGEPGQSDPSATTVATNGSFPMLSPTSDNVAGSISDVSRGSQDFGIDMRSEEDLALAELQQELPFLPTDRLQRILNVFNKELGNPSMLHLVPILRENMPDYMTQGWIKRKNSQTAQFVMERAKEEDLVDRHMLNGLLQVKSSAGSLDETLACHEEQFSKYGITPTPYSDRLVMQMLVRNNRLSRALVFKQKIEEDGRHLDPQSYGSLIEYYGRRQQMGSALLLLKECVAIHGAPPGDDYLASLRLLGRQNGMEDAVARYAGEDPLQWLRHGEANKKREMSKKGRWGVQVARHASVNI